MKRELTCIVCPMGCNICVEIENGTISAISGNTCKRGEAYAKSECTNPQRTVTSTVCCDDGSVIPVKTATPIPKEDVADCMKIINSTTAHLPISVGDVIIEDVFGSKVVATANSNA